MKIYNGTKILFSNIKGRVLNIVESVGIFVELEQPVITTLGFKTNRVWITNSTLKPIQYGKEKYGLQKGCIFVEIV